MLWLRNMQQRSKSVYGMWLLTALYCWLAINPVRGNAIPRCMYNYDIATELDAASLALRDSLITVINTTEDDSTKSKAIAAILAFPLPFGMLGLHRFYLGAKPIIPILYFVTFGGGFGILPFVDMMVVILSRDTKSFYKNSKILMWYRKKEKKNTNPSAIPL